MTTKTDIILQIMKDLEAKNSSNSMASLNSFLEELKNSEKPDLVFMSSEYARSLGIDVDNLETLPNEDDDVSK